MYILGTLTIFIWTVFICIWGLVLVWLLFAMAVLLIDGLIIAFHDPRRWAEDKKKLKKRKHLRYIKGGKKD
jgi:hypothetical protein